MDETKKYLQTIYFQEESWADKMISKETQISKQTRKNCQARKRSFVE